MDQSQRLDLLVRRFAEDSERYKAIDVGRTDDDKRITLRSLMNIRMPRPMDEDTLHVQDDYLTELAAEKGVVTPEELPAAGLLSVWQGDITRLAADAIVNAANSAMLGCFQPMHNCIDNCIHTYAGIQLRAECARQMAALRRQYGPDYQQPVSVPMLTPGYNLPAKHVIHIVGPIVEDAVTETDRRALAACYENTLDLCAESGLRTVAFCCISTGVFRFPKEEAAPLAVGTVRAWLAAHPGAMDRVIFSVHNDRDRALYNGLVHG